MLDFSHTTHLLALLTTLGSSRRSFVSSPHPTGESKTSIERASPESPEYGAEIACGCSLDMPTEHLQYLLAASIPPPGALRDGILMLRGILRS
jgi:hypothetical protein